MRLTLISQYITLLLSFYLLKVQCSAETARPIGTADEPWHSFAAPYGIDYWSLSYVTVRDVTLPPRLYIIGDATARADVIRLTDDKQSQNGQLWNTIPNTHPFWEATVEFKIHGSNAHIGADGLAFWYTKETGTAGNLFGNTQRFYGMSVIIDTFDNDGTGLHPYILLAFNDGEKEFSHYHGHADEDDSGHRAGSNNALELGGCSSTLRNVGTARLRVVYAPDFTLRVYIKPYESAEEKLCAEASGLEVPAGYYFGFSAATGDLADNHDIVSFTVRNMNEKAQLEDELAPEQVFQKAINKIHFENTVVREQMFRMAMRINDIYEDIRGAGGSSDGKGSSEALQSLSSELSVVRDKFNDVQVKVSYVSDEMRILKGVLSNIERKLNEDASKASNVSLGGVLTTLAMLGVGGAIGYVAFKYYKKKQDKARKTF